MQATPAATLHACERGSEKQSSGIRLQESSLRSYSPFEVRGTENGSSKLSRSCGRGGVQSKEPASGPSCMKTPPAINTSPTRRYDSVHGVHLTTQYRPMTSPTHREPDYEYALGIVNPGSGERGAAQHVLDSMRAVLGADRVLTLDAPLFADPTPLLEAIRHHAVRFLRQETNSPTMTRGTSNGSGSGGGGGGGRGRRLERRGTVIVCGGDGTVSFVMDKLDAVRELIQRTEEGPREGEGARSTGVGSGDGDVRFVLPAVAVLALGTGNDYSHCVGFGRGYSRHKLSCLCGCMENAIEPLLRNVVTAPAIPFDRWTVRLVPLTAIREQQERRRRQKQPPRQTLGAKHADPFSREDLLGGDVGEKKEEGEREGGNREPEAATEDTVDLHSLYCDVLEAAETCTTYNFINYFSIGFDAYVLQKFDTFRRQHPKFCSTRMNNKLVYGLYGLRAVSRCSSLRPCISQICVPQLARSGSIRADAPHKSVGPMPEKTPLMTLPLPKGSKTLLVTNVSSYAAGTRPWREGKGHLYRDDPYAHPMIITPVCVNDHKMEVQAIGGIFEMGLLQMGIGKGACKLAQTREMFAFVLCSPADICRREKSQSSEEATAGKEGGKEHTPLYMQLDGEAIGKITCATVVHITELHRPRVYVRCRNPRVVRHPIDDEDDAF